MIRLCLFLIFLAPAAALAQENEPLTFKDSAYYTMDDGVMSPKEMEMEANDMYRICRLNAVQRIYINCECLAGAFLIRREKEGPMTPQSDIYEDIVKNRVKGVNCANTEAVAGEAYQTCMNYSAIHRELKRDNEEYCTCVGNKVARDFSKRPVMQGGYLSNLDFNAMTFCADPANRPESKKSASAIKTN